MYNKQIIYNRRIEEREGYKMEVEDKLEFAIMDFEEGFESDEGYREDLNYLKRLIATISDKEFLTQDNHKAGQEAYKEYKKIQTPEEMYD